ncbi:hypothetical protein M441DRAFT_64947 [Trichoderma asperellum CBS 433.97]|uniref:Uncharacterized protein n=2 Tax=Trichoderma asperellum TaxID=101201 RepID=A0A2T3ZKE7_TRIA4|nr:hypothetical protein M441DRAFT_64947 [Trichoderma asperellum CBS 433.97]PTB45279.1 hypothetical protein M441DRAFT_64947 [Trichoderma asperellum CBS 433.97]
MSKPRTRSSLLASASSFPLSSSWEFPNFTRSLQPIPLLSSPTASSSFPSFNSPDSSALDAADSPCFSPSSLVAAVTSVRKL